MALRHPLFYNFMNKTITTENQKLCAFLDEHRVVHKVGRTRSRLRGGWADRFCHSLEAVTGNRWSLYDSQDGAYALYYADTHGKWHLFYCGRSGAFTSSLIRWAQINHWTRTKQMLAELEREEAAREAASAREMDDVAKDTALATFRADERFSVDMGAHV